VGSSKEYRHFRWDFAGWAIIEVQAGPQKNLIDARALFLSHIAEMQKAFSYFSSVLDKWLLGKTFFALGPAEDSFWRELVARSYMQLESSKNSANLRTTLAICARVVSAQFC
jgi:hypothetical protein